MNTYIYLFFLIILLILSLFYINKEGFVATNSVSGVRDCQEVYFILDQLANIYYITGGILTDDSNNLVSTNSVATTHMNRFRQLAGRSVTLSDIAIYRRDSIDGNLNYPPTWGSTCRKLTLSNCDKRYTALDKIANANGNKKVISTNRSEFRSIMGRDPVNEEWVNRNTYRYIGCLKPTAR